MWVGDSRGHLEGDSLVVETTNFTDGTNVGLNGVPVQRPRCASPSASRGRLRTRSTCEAHGRGPGDVDGAVEAGVRATARPAYGLFEYACHEGNYALWQHLERCARGERAAAAIAAPPAPTKK